MNLKKAIFGITMAFVLLVSASVSFATTLCVNPTGTGGCYSTINAAIAAAAAVGDTVSVMPGIYVENVSVGKNIALYAPGGPSGTAVIPTVGQAMVFNTGSAGASITGFRIEAPAGAGIFVVSGCPIYVNNCVIQYCSGEGISVTSAGCVRANNNVIYNNTGRGIYFTAGAHYIYNNIIVNNHSTGLHNNANGATVHSEYNCVWGNNPNYSYVSTGIGDISQDPKFADAPNGDFHFQGVSPCINKGRPGSANLDCDGTNNDMGIYGGPNAYCGPGPVVTQLQLVPATVVKGETFNIQARGATR